MGRYINARASTGAGGGAATAPLVLDGTGLGSDPLTVKNGKSLSGVIAQVTGTVATGFVLKTAGGTSSGGVGYVTNSNDWVSGAIAGGTALWSDTNLYIKPSAGAINLWSPSTSGFGGTCSVILSDSNFAVACTSIQFFVNPLRSTFQATVGVASAAGTVWDGVSYLASTLTLSGSTNVTTATGVNLVSIAAPTISAGTALTVTNAATLYVAGAPTGAGAGPATITNKYSLWIDAGLPRFDSTSANASTATVLGTVGPAGANTTVQEWLTIDINGTKRYLPCF